MLSAIRYPGHRRISTYLCEALLSMTNSDLRALDYEFILHVEQEGM